MTDRIDLAKSAYDQISQHLEIGIIPFWLKALDHVHGGYLTSFDEKGNHENDTDKSIVTQTRMIWGLSALYQEYPQNYAIKQGLDNVLGFFLRHFWDHVHEGWRWKVARDGSPLDSGKILYGQSFALYALAENAISTGSMEAYRYAERTFDLIVKYCSDTQRGGYYENLEEDWTVSEGGHAAGDRKSLDVTMHMMEALTRLYVCTKKNNHKMRLMEVIELILTKMIDHEYGCGYNQFTLDFQPIPAISIKRTWNDERQSGETIAMPVDSTSYGHNVELAWLVGRAGDALGFDRRHYGQIIKQLTDHSLTYGFDDQFGGVFSDGPHRGKAYVFDKEWWQNCEVLVGYLDAFERFNEDQYLDAFINTWAFDNTYFINHQVGEWRQLLDRQGRTIVGSLGNQWKCIYHTGRSMLECKRRLERLLQLK